MNGLLNLGLRALSTSTLHQSARFNGQIPPSRPGQFPALPIRPLLPCSSIRQNWTRPPEAMSSRVSSTAQNFFPRPPETFHYSNFSTSAVRTPDSYWEWRMQQGEPQYLDLVADDLSHLDSLSIWIKENGINVHSISLPHEKIEKGAIKRLLKTLSIYYPELPGVGITDPARPFSRVEIIRQPDLEIINRKGRELQRGITPARGVQFDKVPLNNERYLDLLAALIAENTEQNLVVLDLD